jgi:hypothetical protein
LRERREDGPENEAGRPETAAVEREKRGEEIRGDLSRP